MKMCSACKEEKELVEFRVQKGRPLGVTSACRVCLSRQERNLAAAKRRERGDRPIHRLVEKDTEAMTGLCAVCGPVTIVHRGRGLTCSIRSAQTWKRNHLKKSFGMTLEEFEERSAAQDGRCEICRKPNLKGGVRISLSVDHNHTTGAVRGFLCNPCNTLIGRAGDSIPHLLKVIEYLKRYDGDPSPAAPAATTLADAPTGRTDERSPSPDPA
jgi:hypothetical protein